MVEIVEEAGSVATRGLAEIVGHEVAVKVDAETEQSAAVRFLEFLRSYATATGGVRFAPGETISYGSWIVSLQAENEGTRLEAWEREPATDAERFRPGLRFSNELIERQVAAAGTYEAQPDIPHAHQLLVMWAGVVKGEPVQGVRYPSPDHMSGWWLTTPTYPGDVDALETHHVGHLVGWRTDIAELLALPTGFRFDTRPPHTTAHLDPKVATADF